MTGRNRLPDGGPACVAASPDPLDDARGLLEVHLGVVLLGDAGGRVPEDRSRGLEARDLADLRGRGVAELVRRPSALQVPLADLLALFRGEPVAADRRERRVRPGLLARVGDRPPVGARRVVVVASQARLVPAVGAGGVAAGERRGPLLVLAFGTLPLRGDGARGG
jgi:hypothetical protein